MIKKYKVRHLYADGDYTGKYGDIIDDGSYNDDTLFTPTRIKKVRNMKIGQKMKMKPSRNWWRENFPLQAFPESDDFVYIEIERVK